MPALEPLVEPWEYPISTYAEMAATLNQLHEQHGLRGRIGIWDDVGGVVWRLVLQDSVTQAEILHADTSMRLVQDAFGFKAWTAEEMAEKYRPKAGV